MSAKSAPLSSFPVYDSTRKPDDQADFSAGAVFLVDKPTGWSSFDMVKFVRNRINTKKTGHAGTLDPLASGLLILCSGKATKSIDQIQEYPKRYVAEAVLGSSTPSQDATTEPDAFASYSHISKAQILEAISEAFTGEIEQIPPMYSALWKDGKRLYSYARKGVTVERSPRAVEVHRFSLQSFEDNRIILDITCSKGTYVRTLIHDLGEKLGTLAHMRALRRTETGPFNVDNAISMELIKQGYLSII